jgi:hypothetical protein
MSRYLVVAHQTGDSPMLLEKVRELADADSRAEFVVLTPRRPVTMTMMVGGETRTASQIAIWRSRRTVRRLKAAGVTVVASRLGTYDPLQAIEEEIRFDHFAGVIISTLRHGLSSWLHLDLPARVKGRWPNLDVIHVITPSPFYLEDAIHPEHAAHRRSPWAGRG